MPFRHPTIARQPGELRHVRPFRDFHDATFLAGSRRFAETAEAWAKTPDRRIQIDTTTIRVSGSVATMPKRPFQCWAEPNRLSLETETEGTRTNNRPTGQAQPSCRGRCATGKGPDAGIRKNWFLPAAGSTKLRWASQMASDVPRSVAPSPNRPDSGFAQFLARLNDVAGAKSLLPVDETLATRCAGRVVGWADTHVFHGDGPGGRRLIPGEGSDIRDSDGPGVGPATQRRETKRCDEQDAERCRAGIADRCDG